MLQMVAQKALSKPFFQVPGGRLGEPPAGFDRQAVISGLTRMMQFPDHLSNTVRNRDKRILAAFCDVYPGVPGFRWRDGPD